MLRNLGGAIGPVFATVVMTTYTSTVDAGGFQESFPTATAFNIVFATGVALTILVLVLSLTAKNYTFRRNSSQAPAGGHT